MSEREILFRGKIIELCKYQGQWLEGFFGSDNGKTFIAIQNENGLNGYFCDSKTVGQYTGLTDKNGTRIFEGDIVKQEFSKFRQSTNEICEFHDGSFGLKIKDLGIEKFLPFACICNATYKVIGNIYDNPELLKGD